MNIFELQRNEFAGRHIGADDAETAAMLAAIGFESVEALIDSTIPAAIRATKPLEVGGPMSEYEYLKELKKTAGLNKVFKTYIRDNVALAEAPAQQKDIFTYSPKSAGAEDYLNLCKEIIQRMGTKVMI